MDLTPVTVVRAAAKELCKARPWPIASARRVPMPDRVVMDVIEVAREIAFVANVVFPESGLPQGSIAHRRRDRAYLCGTAPLDQCPAQGEVGVVIGQCPHAMEMVGQDHVGEHRVWMRRTRFAQGCAQALDVPGIVEPWIAMRGHHGEEIRASGTVQAFPTAQGSIPFAGISILRGFGATVRRKSKRGPVGWTRAARPAALRGCGQAKGAGRPAAVQPTGAARPAALRACGQACTRRLTRSRASRADSGAAAT